MSWGLVHESSHPRLDVIELFTMMPTGTGIEQENLRILIHSIDSEEYLNVSGLHKLHVSVTIGASEIGVMVEGDYRRAVTQQLDRHLSIKSKGSRFFCAIQPQSKQPGERIPRSARQTACRVQWNTVRTRILNNRLRIHVAAINQYRQTGRPANP